MPTPTLVVLTIEETVRVIEYPSLSLAQQEIADLSAFVDFSGDHIRAEIIAPEQRSGPLTDVTVSAEPYHAALLQRRWLREGGRYVPPGGGEPTGLQAAIEQAGLLYLDTSDDLLDDTDVDDDSVDGGFDHLDDGT